MIVLDLDDTLLRDDLTISARTMQSLMEAQKAGVKVVLASGRPTSAILPIAEELRLKENESFILSFNGAKITNCKTGEEWFSSALPVETVHQLYEISKREKVWIHTYVKDTIVTEEANPYTEVEGKLTKLDIKVVDCFIEAVREPVVKVLMLKEPAILEKVEAKLQREFSGSLSVMRSKPFFLEFTEEGITKGSSLSYLLKRIGMSRDEVIAIGDSGNDLSMIQFAGLGVAMGNASKAIKEQADLVTDTNMNDGVAKVVDEFILKIASVR